jgi:hypothetical protein
MNCTYLHRKVRTYVPIPTYLGVWVCHTAPTHFAMDVNNPSTDENWFPRDGQYGFEILFVS